MEGNKTFLVKIIFIIILMVLCLFQTIYHIVMFIGCKPSDKYLIVGENDRTEIVNFLKENSYKYIDDTSTVMDLNHPTIDPYLVKKTTEKQSKQDKTALTVYCNRNHEYKFYMENSKLGEYLDNHGSNTMIHLGFVLIVNIGFMVFFGFLIKRTYDKDYESYNSLRAKEVKKS